MAGQVLGSTPGLCKNETPVLPPDVRSTSFLSSWLIDWYSRSEAGVHLPLPSPCLTAHLQFLPGSAESPPSRFSNLSPAQDLGILTLDQPTPLPPSAPPKMHLDSVLSPSCSQHPVRPQSPGPASPSTPVSCHTVPCKPSVLCVCVNLQAFGRAGSPAWSATPASPPTPHLLRAHFCRSSQSQLRHGLQETPPTLLQPPACSQLCWVLVAPRTQPS